MSIIFEFITAVRYIKAKNKQFLFSVITFFSILGISLGVATLIVVTSVMNGFSYQLLDNIIGINGHITVSLHRTNTQDYNKLSTLINKVDEVVSAYPITENQVLVKTKQNKVFGAIVKGISKNHLESLQKVVNHIIKGDVSKFNNGIIIGSRLAESLGVTSGDQVTLISPESFTTILGNIPRMKTYTIIAIFDIGMYEYDNLLIYMPLAKAQLFFRYYNTVKNIEIFVNDINQSASIAQNISNKLNIVAEDWRVQQSHYFNALKIESNVMFFILTLIVVVATFNIISGLVILVEDKKDSIAIMRTIGATRQSIMRIFCICGLIIGLVGTLLGCILGISFALNINQIKNFLEIFTGYQLFDPVIYFFNNLPSILDPIDVFKITILSCLLSFFATILPARKAASQEPVDILRYE